MGGPGQAWQIGFGWVYMAVVQVTALVLLYGIFGKKMALVSRKLNAVTVVDVVRARYGSNALANCSALVIVLFFAATMVAQFVGGAKLFEAVTGYSYLTGLVLFGIAVILFTTIGGFRGVAVTDALYLTQWLLVGVFTFVLPQSVVRTMGYKDVKSLHKAMIWGTVIIGAMMIGVTALGVLAAGVLTEDLAAYGGSVDNIIPTVIVQSLPPALAGVAIIGPLSASISTVSSLLISSSSAIIKDVYLRRCGDKGRQPAERSIAFSSQAVTFVVGVLVFVLSIVPPDVIWKINMFAFGGLETAFLFVLVGGLFWKRATATGALLSLVGGTLAYCAAMAAGFKVAGLHQIVIGVAVAGVLMVVGALASKQKEDARMDVFFPVE